MGGNYRLRRARRIYEFDDYVDDVGWMSYVIARRPS